MSIPNMLRSRLMVAATRPPAGGALPPRHSIGVTVEDQIGDNWCWAAVSVGIRNSLGFGPVIQQCDLVKIQLGHSDCCTVPVPDPCDQPHQLEIALANAAIPADNFSGSLTFSDLQDRIANDRPVCCAIQWASGAFHFVQVDGYIANGPRGDEVIVNDSAGPGGRMAYDTLVNNYGVDAGTWVWTYRVL
jgi:hypothetical protein